MLACFSAHPHSQPSDQASSGRVMAVYDASLSLHPCVAGGMSGLSDDDDDSEAAELEIDASDLLILAARNEDDVSVLEVWVYQASTLGCIFLSLSWRHNQGQSEAL